MCRRYKLAVPFREIIPLYNLANIPYSKLDNIPARYNIAPSQDVAVIRSGENDAGTMMRTLDMLRWGLVPSWAKDLKIGYSLINAMAETVSAQASFREAFKRRRCIIPADGFYAWKKVDGGTKQPYCIGMKGGEPFGFAGLWEQWTDRESGETVRSCAIITTTPNELVAPIHNRMPVILHPADNAAWLGEAPGELATFGALLRPYPAGRMSMWPVDKRIANVKNQGRELAEPIAV
jgi:putative SOS response-associated peptidase YedK